MSACDINIANIFLIVGLNPNDSITTEFTAEVNSFSICVLFVLNTVIILPILSSKISNLNQSPVLSSNPVGGVVIKSSNFISTGMDCLPPLPKVLFLNKDSLPSFILFFYIFESFFLFYWIIPILFFKLVIYYVCRYINLWTTN